MEQRVREDHRRRLAQAGVPRQAARVRRDGAERRSPDDQGLVWGASPRERRAVSELADPSRRDGAGHILVRPGKGSEEHWKERAIGMGDDVWQRPRLRKRAGPRCGGDAEPELSDAADPGSRMGCDRRSEIAAAADAEEQMM